MIPGIRNGSSSIWPTFKASKPSASRGAIHTPRQYAVQFFTGDDPIRAPNKGIWQNFPFGLIQEGKGGTRPSASLPPQFPFAGSASG